MSLTLTLSFLLIFSLASQSALDHFMRQKSSLWTSKETYRTQHQKQDERERLLFEEKVSSKKDSSRTLKTPSFYKKDQHKFRHVGVLNLYELLKNKKEYPIKEHIFCKLFDRLYQNETFYHENLGRELLEALRAIATCSQDEMINKTHTLIKTPQELASLTLKDLPLQRALYKVLKGSQVEGEDGGYPSLCDFLVAKNYPSLINLYLAPYDLLCVLFDERMADYIFSQKSQWKQEYKESKKTSETGAQFGERILKKILKDSGKEGSKLQSIITFRIQSK